MAFSKNKNTIDSLAKAQGQKDPDLKTILEKVSQDLGELWNALFSGPLPAVSAENLTDIPTDQLDAVLERDQLPDEIVYNDVANTLNGSTTMEDSLFVKHANGLQFAVGQTGSLSQVFHISFDNPTAVLGQNLWYDGAYNRDDTGAESTGIVLHDGEIYFVKFIGGNARAPLFFDEKAIKFHNAAWNLYYIGIEFDANDVFQLGSNAASSGLGHVAIPDVTSGNLPSAAAMQDGTIVIDTTNNRLCYYANGNRYHLTGVSF